MRRESLALFIGVSIFLFFLLTFLFFDFNNFKEWLSRSFSISKNKISFTNSNITKEVDKEVEIINSINLSLELKDYDRAKVKIDTYFENFSHSTNISKVYFLAGKLFYEIKDYDRAIAFLEKSLKNENSCNSDIEHEGILLISKLGREIERFDPVVFGILSKYARAYRSEEIAVSLGYQLIYARAYDEAIKIFSKFQGEEALIGLARAYIEKGDYKNAINSYIRYFDVADSLSEKFYKVRAAFLKQTLYYADKTYEAKNYKEASYYYELLAKTFPDREESDVALLKIGLISIQNKDYTNAISFLERALKNKPTNSNEESMYYLGVSYYSAGQRQKSFETFVTFLNTFPTSSRTDSVKEWLELIKKEF
ncbi:MAG: tetratricopeptide repeat protein [Brevinematia bacterium]